MEWLCQALSSFINHKRKNRGSLQSTWGPKKTIMSQKANHRFKECFSNEDREKFIVFFFCLFVTHISHTNPPMYGNTISYSCACIQNCLCVRQCICLRLRVWVKMLTHYSKHQSYLDEWFAQSFLVYLQHNVTDLFIRQAERAQENCCCVVERRESFPVAFIRLQGSKRYLALITSQSKWS